MQVKTFLAAMGIGAAVGALGILMFPKSSGIYTTAENAAETIKDSAEKAVDSITGMN